MASPASTIPILPLGAWLADTETTLLAYAVLGSIALLLALLVHGRIRPAILFPLWATSYYLTGLVDQHTFLSGFTNPALTALVLLLMISLALERSPILDRISGLMFRGSVRGAVFRLSSFSLLYSAFVNNTAVVGSMLGLVTRQHHVPPSKLLIPLSYASILGGVTTLVGTSTNLVVSSFAVNAGLPALSIFQFAWVGIPVAIVCVAVLVIASRWLPANEPDDRLNGQSYFLEAQVQAESPLVGHSIEENHLRRLDGLFLVEIMRNNRLISPVGPEEVLEAGDILIFSGETRKVQSLHRFQGLQVFGAATDKLLGSNLIEVIISNESVLANRTLREVDFRTMFDAAVVGIRRGERRLTGQLGQIRLGVGDSLLLAVGKDFRQHRNLDRNFHVLDGSVQRPRLSDGQNKLAASSFCLVIALSAAGWLALLDGLLVLLALYLAAGLVTLDEIRRRFPFELVLIIGAALSIASALEASGAAGIIASLISDIFGGWGPIGALIGIYLVTVALTELITNNAAAALAFPLGLSCANAFGVDPTPFIMVVAYGASAGFMLPFGYQTHLMVYSPGRYRLSDYFRVGLPVSLAYGVTVLLLVPLAFPFHP